MLRHRPDLVFIEFAVNDSAASTHAILQGMEGIVRQAWRADPTIDICFIYTLKGSMLAELQAGRRPASILAMEQVAGHYRIPAIDLGPEVAHRVAAGSLVFRAHTEADRLAASAAGQAVFSSDDVHPLAAGHALYADVVARCLATLSPGAALPHILGPPLVEDNLEQARLVPLDQVMLGQGWRRLDPETDALARTFTRRLPDLYAADVGTTLTFLFTGTAVGFYDLLGPDCGQVQVRLDGGPIRLVPRFDGYCTYHRLARLAVAAGLPAGEHRVELTVVPGPDKAAVLFPDNRQDLQRDPGKYAGATWYVGGIMLVGDVLDWVPDGC